MNRDCVKKTAFWSRREFKVWKGYSPTVKLEQKQRMSRNLLSEEFEEILYHVFSSSTVVWYDLWPFFLIPT